MLDAVTDTGPFIHLDEIQHLDLLSAVFNTILVPEQVFRELSNQTALTFIEQHPKTIQVEPVPDDALFAAKDAYPGFRLQGYKKCRGRENEHRKQLQVGILQSLPERLLRLAI